MEPENTRPTRGERWLWRLLMVTTLVAAVWWYAWPWLRSDRLFLVVAALSLLLVGSAWGWLLRTRRRRAAERAAHLDRDLWRGTVPLSVHAPTQSADERVV